MNEPRDDDWSREELELLARLPREREPRPELLDRAIGSLRARGRLGPVEGAPRRLGRVLQLGWVAAVFVAGVAVGAWWVGAAPPSAATPLPPAESVQRAGSEYVAALVDLEALPASAAAAEQGREVALSTLRGAAERVALLPGQDPEAASLLLAVRNLAPGEAPADAPAEGGRWF